MTSKPSVNRDNSSMDSSGPGFQAHIKGASLADLIQMECLAGSRRIVRVTSGGHIGYLYFRGGSVVHAAARSLTGESAAIEMLGWSEGTFEPIDREWPTRETISTTWQGLLIHAAQMRDERDARSVVALRTDGRAKVSAGPIPIGERIEFDVTPIQVAGHTLRSEDFELVVRITGDGAVVAESGNGQGFADIAAYALRLSELIGEGLGAERFVAMECTFATGHCFIVAEESGEVVALRPRTSADSGLLRELFGL